MDDFDKLIAIAIALFLGYEVYTSFFKKNEETPLQKTEEIKEYKMTMEDLESAIDAQVNSGIGQRYHNINEAARALDNEQRIKQDSRLYQTVQCSSCGAKGGIMIVEKENIIHVLSVMGTGS